MNQIPTPLQIHEGGVLGDIPEELRDIARRLIGISQIRGIPVVTAYLSLDEAIFQIREAQGFSDMEGSIPIVSSPSPRALPEASQAVLEFA